MTARIEGDTMFVDIHVGQQWRGRRSGLPHRVVDFGDDWVTIQHITGRPDRNRFELWHFLELFEEVQP